MRERVVVRLLGVGRRQQRGLVGERVGRWRRFERGRGEQRRVVGQQQRQPVLGRRRCVVTIAIASAPALSAAAVYQLVGTKAGVVAATASAPVIACSGSTCRVTYTLPATSATTIALH